MPPLPPAARPTVRASVETIVNQNAPDATGAAFFSQISPAVYALLDRPIAFQRAFLPLTGGVLPSLLLSQALFLSITDGDRPGADGWFTHTRKEWEADTGLNRREQESARAALRAHSFWHEVLRGNPGQLHYKVDVPALMGALARLMAPTLPLFDAVGCGTPGGDGPEKPPARVDPTLLAPPGVVPSIDTVIGACVDGLIAQEARDRAKADAAGHVAMRASYAVVAKAQKGLCAECARPLQKPLGRGGQEMRFMYRTPLENGGAHMEANIDAVHGTCFLKRMKASKKNAVPKDARPDATPPRMRTPDQQEGGASAQNQVTGGGTPSDARPTKLANGEKRVGKTVLVGTTGDQQVGTTGDHLSWPPVVPTIPYRDGIDSKEDPLNRGTSPLTPPQEVTPETTPITSAQGVIALYFALHKATYNMEPSLNRGAFAKQVNRLVGVDGPEAVASMLRLYFSPNAQNAARYAAKGHGDGFFIAVYDELKKAHAGLLPPGPARYGSTAAPAAPAPTPQSEGRKKHLEQYTNAFAPAAPPPTPEPEPLQAENAYAAPPRKKR